ncbi:MAG: glutathione S-transferase family protein [Devosia sp.]|nr:glutathione S-transferase family protein [Devosia sp.]
MPTLYDFELSANCYKVRLMAAVLGLPLEIVPVDVFPGREHRSAAFLAVNPLGEVPVLADGGLVLRDSHAALVYLARAYDASGRWLPTEDPAVLAEIESWHGFARQLSHSVSVARDVIATGLDADLAACQAAGHRLLRVLDEHLWFARAAGRDWLCVGDHPTTADIACFADVALCEEGGVSRQDYPAVRQWLDRVKRIPGFAVMSGIFPTGPAR